MTAEKFIEMAKLAAGGVVQNLNSNIVKQLDVIVPDMKAESAEAEFILANRKDSTI